MVNMPRSTIRVTSTAKDSSRIPDAFHEGAALIADLRQRELLSEIAERIRIRRQGGYCGFDVFLFFVLFFTAQLNGGINAFWQRVRTVKGPLAALAHRKSLCSSSAISRALTRVDTALIRPHSHWLLTQLPQSHALFHHPALCSYDALGAPCHHFDVDPTNTTLRHRRLPQNTDLPQPHRLAEQLAAPGYSGRKRGELQYRQCTVQHSGTSLWIHAHLSPGNGNRNTDLEACLDSIVLHCERFGIPLHTAIARLDGEFGNMPAFHACRQRKIRFITRLNRPKLLEDPAVLHRLRQADWQPVPDSGTHPHKLAADLGMITIHPGKQTKRPDGSAYSPLTLRVVASIFGKAGDAKRGVKLDGQQIELFVVDLEASAWPAAEAVGSYFGRIAQENRFGQEDRELELDRIFSYHLAGQELVSVIGLLIWNLRVVRGFEQAELPREKPKQPRRAEVPTSAVLDPDWPRDPVIVGHLQALDWSEMLKNRAGWSMDEARGELQCPAHRRLRLTTARTEVAGKPRSGLIFRRPMGGCQQCPFRAECLRSPDPRAPKHVEFAVPLSVSLPLQQRLLRCRQPDEKCVVIEAIDAQAGMWRCQSSLFLPARARHAFRNRLREGDLRMVVSLPPPVRSPFLLAKTVADKQRRRKSWQENVERYQLSPEATLQIEVAGSKNFTRLFTGLDPTKQDFKSTG